MEALFVSFSTVTFAEMGDRTQLLSLMLVARYGRPWLILAGILAATFANHLTAGFIGAWFGRFLDQAVLDMVVGTSMIVMALSALVPDKIDDEAAAVPRRGVFFATLVAFFVAEIGDKTQVATVALVAAYSSLAAVVVGTTAGMLAANLPVVLLGKAFASKLPMRAIHVGASVLFVALGFLFIVRALASQ